MRHQVEALARAGLEIVVDLELRGSGQMIVAVRAPFIEGRRIYPQSALYERGQIQIAVRDRLIIRDVWRE